MQKHKQVIIVGGGPVGVGLAVELGMRGVSCAVIERRTELSAIPKGQGLSQRTLEHFFFWGIVADELRAARTMTHGHPIGQVTVYDNLMGEFWHAPPGREVVNDYYFQANERLPQYRTEEVLRRRVADFPHVDSLLGWTATKVEQDDHGVRVTVEKDGTQDVLEGSHVVGCDGARSVVREQSDIARSGIDFDQVMALAVFRSRELHEALKRFPERSTYRVVHPDLQGYWMFFGRVDVGEQWFFHAPVPVGTDVGSYDFEALLHRAAGFEFSCEIEHVGLWDLRVEVAHEYRRGRVFIAGDAAHTHPPYGGFGLNNGLEDAVNLGWKLAAVVDGWGGEGLLDSYSSERRDVFRDIGENMIAAGIKHERDLLARYSPDRDVEEFSRVFAQIASSFGAQVRDFEPHYEGSRVVVGPEGGVNSAHGVHTFTARAGHHLPPRLLSSGRNVYEELGTTFALLALDADEPSVSAFEEAADSAGIPLKVICDTFAGGREAYECRLILVRPDQYVAWTGDKAADDVELLMRTVSGTRPLTASATVRTATAERYAKQLVSHLGRRADVVSEPEGDRILIGTGSCLLVGTPEALLLRAEAPGVSALDRVKDVVSRHLVRFGARDELVVAWVDGD
jgi:2-polyprenyl-6-methoxyphenol hydroxylase-like FAD-dependent oxidoreductase